MRRVCLVLALVAAACGGPQIPTHNGYKSEKAKPWKSPKKLAFNDKMEAKADGSLSYPAMERAKWYVVELPVNAELTYRLEITPPGEGTNEDFDLAAEVLSPANRVISKADAEDTDAHELVKTHTLVDLAPGRYLIHLYLEGRLDTADYVLTASYKPVAAAQAKTDFPAQVAFLPALAMVPLDDDTPVGYHPTKPTAPTPPPRPHHGGGPPPPPPIKPVVVPATGGPVSARIINLQVTAGGTNITVSRGSDTGVTVGMHGVINGVAGGNFTVTNCSPRTCTGTTHATPDQIKTSGGAVTLSP